MPLSPFEAITKLVNEMRDANIVTMNHLDRVDDLLELAKEEQARYTFLMSMKLLEFQLEKAITRIENMAD